MADSRNSRSSSLVATALTDSLARHARGGQLLSVAYSGGADSAVLLHAAKSIAPVLGFHLSAIHVHHGLSPNADEWSYHCERSCAHLGIELRVIRVKVEPERGEGVEAAARRVRLEALLDHPADRVLMAHHADDQAETVLHNLLRGAGPRGAAAIPELRGRVLRPFLNLPRQTLLAYAEAHKLAWLEDESNADRKHTRNFLRHEVLPVIKRRFPRAVEQLSAAARRFGDVQLLLDDLALNDLGTDHFSFPASINLLRGLSEVRAQNAVRALLSGHKVQLPDERRLNEFVRQLRTAANDRHPRLEMGAYVLWATAGMLHFRKEPDSL